MNTLNNQEATIAVGLSNKEKALAILTCLETRDAVGPTHISDERYIQHNLVITDNKPGFLALQSWLPEGNKVNILRAFEDGDHVFVHAGYNLGGPMVGMDIFRFENGKAVEHWDNLQLVPTDSSFEEMTAGKVSVGDHDQTATNKSLVANYAQSVLVEGQKDKAGKFIDQSNYSEHQPVVPGSLQYNKVHLVLGEGNFVMVQSEGQLDGKSVGLYDLFRVEQGKIAEHWNTIEAIPAKADWQNPNGKF
jgi:predicted SnoaL-like aldol condensation-catalyzing enzyme